MQSAALHPFGKMPLASSAAINLASLSTISGHKLEDLKAFSAGLVFYQLYLMGGRGAWVSYEDEAQCIRPKSP
jgi:hypothetical protein